MDKTVKRIANLAVSLIALAFLSPFFIALIVMMKLFERSPAIFKQQRAGKNGRPFTFYKFRTMRTDVDPFGPSPKSGDDPRVTKIGRFLREHSLDELPQFFNVLKGDMGIVGLRPSRWSHRSEAIT